MLEHGVKNPNASLESLGLRSFSNSYWNLSPEELVKHSLSKGLGKLASNGALVINTGKFTGRAPKDRYIVHSPPFEDRIDWGTINQPVSESVFERLYNKITHYFQDKDLYVKDGQACADERYRLNVRLICEYPWSSQFFHNMFIRPTEDQLLSFEPEWHVLCAPGLLAIPAEDGIKNENFAIIHLEKKQIIIGGTGYTGEIKKGIFSVLNFLLPIYHDVFPMHCSANIGQEGDTAIFFGLSGTGKTTLSADPERKLIGDDEHGWSHNTVFNFEGGCYAKTINLSEEKEPDIYHAIRPGAILENIGFERDSNIPDYYSEKITQNTRVSYPIYHIENALEGSIGGRPTNIFFLTCDAFGILPPISKLTGPQAMYYFISGYTAKIAGTEEGIVDPEATFSACFGAPFLPLHPTIYAEMLGQRMEEQQVNVWLVNTGWTGGSYGTGRRISLKYTRAMIAAALNGSLNRMGYEVLEPFGLKIPKSCEFVPDKLLNPRNTWEDKNAYDQKAGDLANMFVKNFEQYADEASAELLGVDPTVSENSYS